MRKVAGRLKLELSQYRDLEAFAQFGSDLDADTQRTLARGARLVKTLNQGERQPLAVGEQVAQIYAATNGYTDRVELERVEEFHRGLVARLRAESQDLLAALDGGNWSDETQGALRAKVAEFADDFGYDLDEEGQAVEGGADSDRVTRRDRGAAASDGAADGAADGDGDRTPVGAGAGAEAGGSVRA
jgi:F-type H+-transporting ATPase subunit alpha